MTNPEQNPQQTIVVTGIGVVTPYGIGMAALEAGLLAGKSCLLPTTSPFPGFDGTTSAITDLPEMASPSRHRYSRSDQLALVAAQDAVAGFDRSHESFRNAGIVLASTVGGLSDIDPTIVPDLAAWYRQGDNLARAAAFSVARAPASIAEHLGTHGPHCAVSVACASGAMAIALGANMLLDGAAPMVLVGGTDALCPFTLSGFSSLQSLDREPCRPFDRNRKGLNVGEAGAVLVLETLAAARARGAKPLAVLAGWAMTNDATHPTAPQKQGTGLSLCIQRAMQMAHAGVDDIGYVNAHGTGTPLNDIAEANAFEHTFAGRTQPIPISSTKSYIGHCMGAAGSVEAAITILSLRTGTLFPTLRLTDPIESERIEWLRGQPRHQPISMAISVSLGFGGSNAAILLASPNCLTSGSARR